MGMLTSTIEDSMKSGTTPIADKGIHEEEENDRNGAEEDQSSAKEKARDEEGGVDEGTPNTAEEKRLRLKRGFTVCKPRGTFLWPTANSGSNGSSNSNGNRTTTAAAANTKAGVQEVEEDLFLVPTPSASSSSSAPPLPFPPPFSPATSSQAVGPPSPVKPLAERRAVKVTVSTISRTLPPDFFTPAGEKKALLNLNEVPLRPASLPNTCSYGAGFCGTPSSHPHLTVPTSPLPPLVSFSTS